MQDAPNGSGAAVEPLSDWVNKAMSVGPVQAQKPPSSAGSEVDAKQSDRQNPDLVDEVSNQLGNSDPVEDTRLAQT